ncbi:MAG: CHAT domain-containing protein, partial [Anaerolineae bacterium]
AAARREEEITALLGQLKLRNEEYLSLRQVHAPLLSDIQRHLPDDALLIEYYLARDRIVAFTLTWDGLGVHDGFCRPAQVWELLDQLTFQLNKFRYGRSYVHRHLAALRVSAEDCLAQLYRGLIEPLVAELADRQLIIVPHGALHYVPFHALHDGQGYLIESHQVSYAPSASVLKFCLEKDGSDAAGVLIMGLPDERIPHVLGEVEAVGSVFAEPLLFTGPAATVSRLQEHGPGCDVIHLATHAMFRQDNPLFSALKLADGWLIVHDIYNLDLGASLVTLSACETGVSRVAAGDELIGLVRGFLYAGTSSLVVSLWAVNDKSTAYLMRRFYRGLQAGQGNAAALREAQLETRERYDHPYYWAPFVLMGQCH